MGDEGVKVIHVSQLLGNNKPVVAHKSFPRSADAGFTTGGEGKLGGAGVTAIEGPFRLAVTNYEDARGRHRLR